jgi:hypothetical protein
MNIFERALTPETYTNALADPGSAIKNVVSDPAFGLVAGMALGPAGYGLSSGYAALAAGGISALATGSLQKGFMTGLSAYGGAGLGASLSSAGQAALPGVGSGEVNPFASAGRTAATEATRAGAEASALDKLSAGFGSVTSSPEAALQFAKDNYGKALMAAGPILADQMVATKTPLPTAGSLTGPSYIRPYSMTRKVRQPEKDSGSREQDWFETTWERGTPYKAANGGIVALAGGGTTSQDAYDFLMGKQSDTGSMVNTITKAPTYEGRYEYDPITGTSRFVPARMDMTTALKPVIQPTTTTTPTTDTTGITTLVPASGNPNAAAAQAAAFAAMTPAQQATHQAQMAALSEGLTPVAVKVLKALKNQFLFKAPNEPLAPVVNMDTLSPAAVAEGSAATSSGGVSSTSGSPMGGIASTGTVGQANAANAAIGAAIGNATSGGMGGMGGMGGGGGSGMGGMGTGAAGAAASAAATGGMGGGGGGGGGGSGGGSSGSGMGGMGTGAAGAGASAGVGGAGGATGGYVDNNNFTYHMATGGLSDLGSYSDGGRLLRGPGDGVSDSIPAMIGKNQPARLADGEFVVPARIVSEIGNGSTEAGARKLYAMMDRIQAARRKTVGKGKVAANTKTDKYLPA